MVYRGPSFKTFHNYTLDRGYGNVQLDVEYRGKDYSTILEAGTRDAIDVFQVVGEPRTYLVLTTNTGLSYIGLVAYVREKKPGLADHTGKKGLMKEDEVFLQDDWNIEEVLGKKWKEKSDLRNAKILYQYLSY